jgi:DNA-directed RNA polymerase subunit beta
MAKTAPASQDNKRVYYTKSNDILDLPNLVDHQNKSWQWLVEEGLGELLAEVSPIDDYTGTKLSLAFKDYRFEDPKISEVEARENNVSYEAPLKATVELTNKVTGEVKEQEIYLGDYPWMTSRGTFVINGAERVVVSSRGPKMVAIGMADETVLTEIVFSLQESRKLHKTTEKK